MKYLPELNPLEVLKIQLNIFAKTFFTGCNIEGEKLMQSPLSP